MTTEESIKLLTKNNKALWLAYDQGMEHGTIDFNNSNIDPKYILDIAISGYYSGVIFGRGIAEKYYQDDKYKGKVPLIIKANGKTRFHREDPISPLLCTVDEAKALGAIAIGYTVYVGAPNEHLMLSEFARLISEAHEKGLAVVGWMYPRGKLVGELTPEIIAYGARVGMELGADFVKVSYPKSLKNMEWVVKAAGRTNVMIAGGDGQEEDEFLKMAKTVIDSGATGLAVGRNVWQAKNPIEISKKLSEIVFRQN